MPDGADVAFPDDMPKERIKALIVSKFPDAFGAPKQPMGIIDSIKQQWDNPSPGGLMSIAKGVYDLGGTANKAAQGGYDPPPETPGTLTEGDIQNRTNSEQQMIGDARSGAMSVMTGAVPLGGVITPRGALAMGGARPGRMTGSPVPPPPGTQLPPVEPPAGMAAMAPETVGAANRIGVSVPRYLVDDRRMTQGMAAGLQNIPGAGDKIARAAERTVSELGGAANTIREGYGSGVPSVAGTDAKEALSTWITDGSKKTAEKLYSKVDQLVDPAINTELKTTANAAQAIMARREASKIPGDSGAVKTVMDAVTTPGGMNYQGIKGLRSFIGEMSPEELVAQGLNKAEAKQIYGALSADLRMSALNGGGAPALTAFNKANRVYDMITDRRDALAKIIGTKGDAAPEAVFARIAGMASNKTNADIGKLLQARKAIGPEAWDEVASAVVAKLGRDPQGEFSVGRFLGPNGYGGLSDSGKNVLFRSTGRSDLARSLDDLAFVTTQIEDKLKKFYNPSGTAKSLVSTGLVLGVIHSPITTLSTLLAGGKMASVLSEPATARAAADWAKAYHATLLAPHMASRSRAVREAAEKLAGLISKGDPSIDSAALVAQMMAGQAIGAASPSRATTKP